jgi:hypothetical protein
MGRVEWLRSYAGLVVRPLAGGGVVAASAASRLDSNSVARYNE